MNAKKCKALRSIARERTAGKPASGYLTRANGQSAKYRRMRLDSAIQHPHFTRGYYHNLKRIARGKKPCMPTLKASQDAPSGVIRSAAIALMNTVIMRRLFRRGAGAQVSIANG